MVKADTINEAIEFALDSFIKIKELSEQIRAKTEEIKNLSRQLAEQSAEAMENPDPLVVQLNIPENKNID